MPAPTTPPSPSTASASDPTASSIRQPLKRIVVGVDFSDSSDRALSVATELAARHAAGLTIVHAVDPMVATLEPTPQSMFDDVREALEQSAAKVKARGISVETSLRLAKPWWALEEACREAHADLVVLASHGRSGLARLALGSTADRVLRSCSTPALMLPVHRGMAAASPATWDHALVGVDFSEESLAAARLAARILSQQADRPATITLFHTIALTVEFRGPDSPVAMPQHWDQAEKAAQANLENVAAGLRSSGIEVRCVTYRGYPSDGMLAEAKSVKASLIAVGTHGRGAVNRLLLGSVAERVLHESVSPVLTVRHAESTRS